MLSLAAIHVAMAGCSPSTQHSDKQDAAPIVNDHPEASAPGPVNRDSGTATSPDADSDVVSEPDDVPDPADETPARGPNPFSLGFSVNHDGNQRVLRGWPLVLRISAAFEQEPTKGERYVLDDDTLQITVRDVDGKIDAWPLALPTTSAELEDPELSTKRTLNLETDTLEVNRLLRGADTKSLARGKRTVEVTWGPARESFVITVADPAAEDEFETQARVLLEADALIQLGDFDEALLALDGALDAAPESISLLNQRALVRERMGDAEGALPDAQAALAAFGEQYPDADEPPVTILGVLGRVTKRLLEVTP